MPLLLCVSAVLWTKHVFLCFENKPVPSVPKSMATAALKFDIFEAWQLDWGRFGVTSNNSQLPGFLQHAEWSLIGVTAMQDHLRSPATK